jgi:hypothetical protein
MPDNYQLSAQVDDLRRRLEAVEDQVATLSSRLGVPFTPAASGAVFDPRLGTGAPDPRMVDPAFDPMLAPVPPPAPDPSFGAPPPTAPADPRIAGLTPEIVSLARQGKKIQAIKLYRAQTGLGLKESKDVIDSL